MERKEASFKLRVQEVGSICFNGKADICRDEK
jgi:hypothetical protein